MHGMTGPDSRGNLGCLERRDHAPRGEHARIQSARLGIFELKFRLIAVDNRTPASVKQRWYIPTSPARGSPGGRQSTEVEHRYRRYECP